MTVSTDINMDSDSLSTRKVTNQNRERNTELISISNKMSPVVGDDTDYDLCWFD